MTQPIPHDPTAMILARLIVGLIVLLAVLSFIPRQDTPLAPIVRAQAPQPVIVVTPTAHQAPPPREPQRVQIVQEAAPTTAPDLIAAQAPPSVPASQIVHNADGSISLPGSEAWMDPEVDTAQAPDPIAQAAADAYKQLPIAVPPSAENEQPVTVRRPHTGR